MKLTRYVHHLNNFHLLKTEGVNQRAAEGASKNPPKMGYFRKDVEILGFIKKKSCGISMGLSFWPWNFQVV